MAVSAFQLGAWHYDCASRAFRGVCRVHTFQCEVYVMEQTVALITALGNAWALALVAIVLIAGFWITLQTSSNYRAECARKRIEAEKEIEIKRIEIMAGKDVKAMISKSRDGSYGE